MSTGMADNSIETEKSKDLKSDMEKDAIICNNATEHELFNVLAEENRLIFPR